MPEKMIAFCGIVCDDCRAYIATQRNDEELKKEVAKSWSTEKDILKPGDINCGGCFAGHGVLFRYCLTCEVRRCGCQKGVENCAHCEEFPCEKLTGFWKSMGTTEPQATLEGIKKDLRS